MTDPDVQHSLWSLTERLAAGGPGHGGGLVAAAGGALAAALVTLVARTSRDGTWQDAGGVAAQGAALRERARRLAESDAQAYADATGALQLDTRGARSPQLGDALQRAADVPAGIVTACADVAELAATASKRVPADRRPDAAVAAILAEASARAALVLVEANLVVTSDDERVVRGRREVADAARARDVALRVLDALPGD